MSGSPFASDAVGLNEYTLPIVAVVSGEPESVGATLDADVARSENAANEVVLTPSVTLIDTPVHRPTALGVPNRRPVLVSKLAHEGLLAMLNMSVLPSGSDADGRKLYGDPTITQD
jgi:hypothetical protein